MSKPPLLLISDAITSPTGLGRITRELDIQIADFREEALNNLLAAAWEKFRKSLETGETVELESDYESWVERALEQAVTIKPVDPE